MTIKRCGAERLADLEPLWKALHQHQRAVAPSLGPLAARDLDESWAFRRKDYEQWLTEPGAFSLIAESAGQPVGYAVVRLRGPYHGWRSGDQMAVVESLAVVPDFRNRELGTRLLDTVEQEIAAAGVQEILIGVIPQNVDAQRLYERRGMTPVFVYLLGTVKNRDAV